MSYLDTSAVFVSSPVEASKLQSNSKQGMDGIPVLDMEKVYAVAENAFVVTFDSKSLSGVDTPEASLQLLTNFLFGRRLREGIG